MRSQVRAPCQQDQGGRRRPRGMRCLPRAPRHDPQVGAAHAHLRKGQVREPHTGLRPRQGAVLGRKDMQGDMEGQGRQPCPRNAVDPRGRAAARVGADPDGGRESRAAGCARRLPRRNARGPDGSRDRKGRGRKGAGCSACRRGGTERAAAAASPQQPAAAAAASMAPTTTPGAHAAEAVPKEPRPRHPRGGPQGGPRPRLCRG